MSSIAASLFSSKVVSRRLVPALLLSLMAPAADLAAQDLPTLTPADYGQWESLGSMSLDPTGSWVVVSVTRVDESRELQLAPADGSGSLTVLEHATGGVFSRDGRRLAYRKGLSPEEREEQDEEDLSARDRIGIYDLVAGRDTVLHEVRSFALRDDGLWLATLAFAATDSAGADLIVMNLETGTRTTLGNVDTYTWQPEGPLLGVTVRTAWGEGNGVVVFDPDASIIRTLDSKDARYRRLTWEEDSGRLAVLRSHEAEDREGESHDVLVWDDAADPSAEARILAGAGRAELADSMRITEFLIRFSESDDVVFVGLRPWDPSPPDDEDESEEEEDGDQSEEAEAPEGEAEAAEPDEVEPADVQVWHWDDDRILRAQEWSADQDERRTMLAAWHLEEDRLVVLGRDLLEPVRLVAAERWGLVPDYDPYLFERRFGARTADWYRVDIQTGERTPLAEKVEFGVQTGSDGSTALVYRDDRWHALDLHTGDWTAVGEGSQAHFTRSLFDYDFPGPRPNWGVGGWIEGGQEALLYDKHDVWRANLESGEITRLTRGHEEGLQFRVVNLHPDGASEPLEADQAVWLSVRHLRTKASGYARVGRNRAVSTLLFEEAAVGRLLKARDAERYALRMERWDDSPDAFVAGVDLVPLRQVTRTNEAQSDFAWGHTELLPYTTDAGHDLQAMLIYPAEFQEGTLYPLILYQYERLSDGLHRYRGPSRTDYYNPQVWSQQGYFVLMPDIVYEPGRPGPSALDAVEHALDAALGTGHVDPERMGLIGHSWGGYQASYLPTRTDRFAASVAGAAITNFLSFMGAVHWNGGLPETGHWETGQARMAVPFWDDFEGHLESSPVHRIHELNTPVLLMHGDADGVVDFRQGLEFYNYARRAGKEVVMLVYPGADHGLRKEEHQVDYQTRILEWFAHYLKGESAASWITEGESWVQRADRLEGG